MSVQPVFKTCFLRVRVLDNLQVGAAFISHSLHLPDGKVVKFEIWSALCIPSPRLLDLNEIPGVSVYCNLRIVIHVPAVIFCPSSEAAKT